MELRVVQKNELFQLVSESGLAHANFSWVKERDGDNELPKIIHTPTGYYFMFDYSDKYGFFCTFAPFMTAEETLQRVSDWAKVKDYFEIWLGLVRDDNETPNFWAAVQGAVQTPGVNDFLKPMEGAGNEQFTLEEKSEIETLLDQFREHAIRTYALDQEQIKILSAQTEYLKEAAKRVGKIDWKNLLAAGLIQLTVGLSLNLEMTKNLFQMASLLFKGILGTPDPVPELPMSH